MMLCFVLSYVYRILGWQMGLIRVKRGIRARKSEVIRRKTRREPVF